MLSFNNYIEEGIGGRIIATGAGLIGGPFGGMSSIYDIEKEKEARHELAKLQGKPIDASNTPSVGKYALYGIGGFVPGLIGAVSSNLAYSERLKAEQELENYKKQNNIPTNAPIHNANTQQNNGLNTFGKTIGTLGAIGATAAAATAGYNIYQAYKNRLDTANEPYMQTTQNETPMNTTTMEPVPQVDTTSITPAEV